MEERIRAYMKNLAEKKLLVSMMQALGQPVDPALIESIRIEEELNTMLFATKEQLVEEVVEEIVEEKEPEPVVLEEAAPPQPPSPLPIDPEPPTAKDLVSKSVEAISKFKPSTQTPSAEPLRETELKGIRREIEEIKKRYSTLAWGSGGGGSVLIRDMSDFDARDSNAFLEGKVMRWTNGMFRLGYSPTKSVTSNAYAITLSDYYIGVNCASTVTITLPQLTDIYTGKEYYVKDESGYAGSPARWIDIYPSGTDKIDGQDYVRLQIDHGGLKFIYRDGWRVT